MNWDIDRVNENFTESLADEAFDTRDLSEEFENYLDEMECEYENI